MKTLSRTFAAILYAGARRRLGLDRHDCRCAGRRVEHFKYGSVGIEPEEGLPYWIWQVLPRMFPDKLPGPGGYAIARLRSGSPGASCPSASRRRTVLGSIASPSTARSATPRPTGRPRTPRASIVPGRRDDHPGPQAFSRFLEAAAADPRFNASDMLAEIGKIGTLSMDRVDCRIASSLIPGTRRALRRHREEFAWMDERPTGGAAASIRSTRSSTGSSRSRSTGPSATPT